MVGIEVIIEAGLDLIMIAEVIQDTIKTSETEHHTVPMVEVVMATTHEVIKGMEEITIMEEVVIGISSIVGIGVDHLRDKVEIGEMTEVRVTAGLDQVLGQVQIKIGLDALSARDYDHFAQECPVRLARETSRETDQIQQLFNMSEDQALTQTLLMDTDKDELTITQSGY